MIQAKVFHANDAVSLQSQINAWLKALPRDSYDDQILDILTTTQSESVTGPFVVDIHLTVIYNAKVE